MLSNKKGIPAILLILLNTFCLAQTWVTWDNTPGSSTAAASAANNPVTGAVSITGNFGGTKKDIFFSPVSSTYSSRLANNFDGAAISNQVLLQEFSSYNNSNTTSVTFTFEKPVKILEFVVTDPDFGNQNQGLYWDDSFSIGMDNGATFGSVSSGISSGGNTGAGSLTSGGAVVTTSGFDHGTYTNTDAYGTEWIIWKNSSAKVKTITINFTPPNTGTGNLPAVLYYAIKVEGLAQTNCTAVPSPQFAANTTATATMNGVTVTRTLSRALYSPGNTGMSTATYCSANYAANYAFVRSSDRASKESATYTFSTPQNNAQFFLMVMGNNASGTNNDRDEALFTLNDEQGNTINTFTLSKNPAGTDCHNIVSIDNTTHIVSSISTAKITSDAAILVNSATPFKSVTITDNRNDVGNNGGYGFYVEICPTSLSGACYRPANTTGTALQTNHGITALQRAGSTADEWPGIIKGAHTALEAKTKGFVINRMASPETAVTSPAEGMIVFDTDENSGEGCLKIYDGTGWKCITTQTCGN